MRLSKLKIREILIACDQGEEPAAIADRLAMDLTTVESHINRFVSAYGSTSYVYAVFPLPKPRVCAHPSLKCLLCGQAQDHIHRHEREEIDILTRRLATAHAILAREGYDITAI